MHGRVQSQKNHKYLHIITTKYYAMGKEIKLPQRTESKVCKMKENAGGDELLW